MKFLTNLILFLIISLIHENKVFALSDYRIKNICRKEKKRTKCINELKIKRLDLIQGKQIEIPVLPFKKK